MHFGCLDLLLLADAAVADDELSHRVVKRPRADAQRYTDAVQGHVGGGSAGLLPASGARSPPANGCPVSSALARRRLRGKQPAPAWLRPSCG